MEGLIKLDLTEEINGVSEEETSFGDVNLIEGFLI